MISELVYDPFNSNAIIRGYLHPLKMHTLYKEIGHEEFNKRFPEYSKMPRII
jgi:hypothetical protein